MISKNVCLYKMFGEYFKACRLESWFGWIFNFGLGSVIINLPSFESVFLVFFAFVLATASIFVLNQYFDREADLENEAKSALSVSSGRITPRKALIFAFSLAALSLVLVILDNANLFPLFFVYLGLCTAYSAPPIRLKNVPIADFLVSGIGAGLLPFLIGLGASHQLRASVSYILLSVMPLILFHSGSHIIQAVGDYEADQKTNVRTFVVRYGRQRSVLVAGFMFLTAVLLPFMYSAFGILSPKYLLLFFIILPLLLSIVIRYTELLRNPSTRKVFELNKTARKYGAVVLAILWFYIIIIKTRGF